MKKGSFPSRSLQQVQSAEETGMSQRGGSGLCGWTQGHEGESFVTDVIVPQSGLKGCRLCLGSPLLSGCQPTKIYSFRLNCCVKNRWGTDPNGWEAEGVLARLNKWSRSEMMTMFAESCR